MTQRRNAAYEVGYGKPPIASRFKKGHSGNPRGRPRGLTQGKTLELAMKELFRTVQVREGETIRRMPALQAVLRSQVNSAAKGNASAQRAVLELASSLDRALAASAATVDDKMTSDLDAARRIAAALLKVSLAQRPASYEAG